MVPRIPRRQQGAVAVTIAFMLLLLLGFMGIAVDFGRLFVVRSELQTALDSCALAGAQELDGASTAIVRARNAGRSAGNLNAVNLQSANWDTKGTIVDADITFRDNTYSVTTAPAAARYIECAHEQPGIRTWMLQALATVGGNTILFPTTRSVSARAVASRASAQSACAVPIAVKPKAGGTAPYYGFQIGEWVTLIGKTNGQGGGAAGGEVGWYNLNASTSASETREELGEGAACTTVVSQQLYTPGVQSSVHEVWNYRFGIYKNGDPGPSVNHPDLSGYAYTASNWKNAVPQNAWAGTPAAGSHATAQNFMLKRAAAASFDDTGTDLKDGSGIAFGDKNKMNSYKTLATPGTSGEHARYGYNRRLVTVPVIDATAHVIDFVCMFMLEPIAGPNDDAHLEFRGNSRDVGSPCSTSGMPGGTAGPMVPVLVR